MQDKRIRILRIVTRLNIGGPAVHTALLVREFNNSEFESNLICGSVSKEEGDMGYVAGLYDVKPVYLPDLKREINLSSDMKAFWKIFKFIKQYKPDIVHTHTAKAGTLGRIAAILAGVPVKIHTFHGTIFHGYFDNVTTGFFIFIERMLALFTDAVIAISEKQKYEITQKFKITDPEKCHIVKLGFNLENFLNAQSGQKGIFRKQFNFREDDILVGIVGRLTAIKNHKMFIDATSYITKNASKTLVDRMKFLIVGGGELKDELLRYSNIKGLAHNIFFTGWIKDIAKAYEDLDIVALTSINEGTPVSLIEAMASSKPVVSTDVGGVKDAVGKTEILVETGNYEQMGEKILELAHSAEKRESLGRFQRDFVKERFSKERLVSELKELYRNLLSKKMRRKT